MGFPPGGGLPIDLAYALAALVAGAFLLLPGLGLAWGLGRRAGWDLPSVAAAAFAFGLAVVGVVALAAHYAGGSLTIVLVACAVAFVALTAAGVRLGRHREPLSRAGAVPAFALAAVAALAAVLERPWFAQTADTFYHLAAVRSLLATGRPMVTDPLYGTPLNVLDPTSGVWHTSLALVAKTTGLDVAWLWPGATAVGAAMTVLAFWVLARAVSRSVGAATVAAAAYLVLSLYLDMRWFGYPNQMSLALVFLALAGVASLMDRPRWPDAALVVAAAFAAISLHLAAATLVVGLSLFLGLLLAVAVLVAGARTGEWRWRPLAALAATGVVLAAVSAAVLLPKSAVVAAAPVVDYTGVGVVGRTVALGPWLVAAPSLAGRVDGVLQLGALLALLAAVPAFGRDDRRALAAFGIAAFPAALLLDPPLTTMLLRSSPYLTSRIAILLPFTIFVAVAWALGRARERGWHARLAVAVALLTLAVAAYLAIQPLQLDFTTSGTRYAHAMSFSRVNDVRGTWGTEALARMSAEFGSRYPVVAADEETSYYLAGLLPVAVVAVPAQHAPFAPEAVDGPSRRVDMLTVTDPGTPEALRRDVLRRRHAAYVLIPAEKTATLAALRAEPALLTPVFETPTLVLFRTRP
jgi:hypothetical protein